MPTRYQRKIFYIKGRCLSSELIAGSTQNSQAHSYITIGNWRSVTLRHWKFFHIPFRFLGSVKFCRGKFKFIVSLIEFLGWWNCKIRSIQMLKVHLDLEIKSGINYRRKNWTFEMAELLFITIISKLFFKWNCKICLIYKVWNSNWNEIIQWFIWWNFYELFYGVSNKALSLGIGLKVFGCWGLRNR